jgi:hypothetical protein
MRHVVRDLYRFGPASITVLMIVASAPVPPSALYHYESLLEHLFDLCLGVALLWHIALIVSRRPTGEKVFYGFYALIHLPIIFAVGIYEGMFLTGNWL